jgi:hypothetical protein
VYGKVFKRGTGKSGGIDYLTSDLDSDGNIRSVPPKVLRGNPELTKAIIDSTDFKQRYTSGVLSFAEKDLPDKIKQELMDSFEKDALMPGMDSDQFNILWVEHRDKNRLELHFVVPNQELKSGKRLAPYYHRADMPRWDNWQEVKNFDLKLASPKEPERKKTITLSKNLPPKKTEALKEINSNIEEMIQRGTIDNRDDVINSLKTAGLDISRVTAKSISIKNPTEGKQNIRLKGAYYEQSFTSRSELAGDFQRARDDYQRDLRENIKRAREKLAEQIELKTEYHRKRYSQEPATLREEPEPKLGKSFDEIQRDIERDREQTKENTEKSRLANASLDENHNRDRDISTPDLSPAGSGLVSVERSPEPLSRYSGMENRGSELGSESQKKLSGSGRTRKIGELLKTHQENELSTGQRPEYSNQTRQPVGQKRKSVGGSGTENGTNGIKQWFDGVKQWFGDLKEGLKDEYDRVRAKIDGWLADFKRTTQERNDQFEHANRRLDETARASRDAAQERERKIIEVDSWSSKRLDQAKRRTDQAIESSSREVQRVSNGLGRGIQRLRENRNDELSQFKSQINLAQYASKQGYELVKNESSRNSYVMKDGAGDKIVVATASDGHGIYFSVRDSSDNGSIIDFHQKRTGDNLGQTRKVLRQELGISTPTEIQTIKSKPRPADRNIEGVIKSVMTMTSAENHNYLTGERKIPAKILKDPRFANSVKADRKGNAVFPHYDENGLSGYELKNTGFTGFSRGGKKAIWRTSNLENAKEIVICESGIDALSHAALHPKRNAAYISAGGQLSEEQKTLLGNVLKRSQENNQKIIFALDNDKGGQDMTRDLKRLAPGAEVEISKSKDWNEDIQKSLQPKRSRGMSMGR